MIQQKKSNEEISTPISAIRAGDERGIDKIYLLYKPLFISWAAPRFSLSEAELTDCWQDSIIAFYEQVASGKLQTLDVALKTYLFAIGRNKMLHLLRSKKAEIKREQDFAKTYSLDENQSQGYTDLEDIKEEQEKILQKAMKSLSERNRAVLINRYYDGLSLEKIQEKEGYNSINAVSATISRAIAILKKIVSDENFLVILLSFATFLQ